MASKVSILIFITVFVAVSAFNSAIVNWSVLVPDLKSMLKISSGRSLNREKREDDIPPEVKEHVSTCCAYSQQNRTESTVDINMEVNISRACNISVTNKLKGVTSEILRNTLTCMIECLLEKHDMIHNDGNIVINYSPGNQFSTFVEFGDTNDIEKWSEQCNKISKEIAAKEEGTFVCNRQPIHYILCLYDVMNYYCPEDYKIIDDECNAWRDKLKDVFAQ